ncbi:MAG: hypothetical protein LBQ12_15000 [Deltaproteobacteria bacterium]|jgi:hypothetical protein|nr:hypothetical protein [Deltaproteobacteria bacterium]
MHAAYLVMLSGLVIAAICVVFEVMVRKALIPRVRKRTAAAEAARKLKVELSVGSPEPIRSGPGRATSKPDITAPRLRPFAGPPCREV